MSSKPCPRCKERSSSDEGNQARTMDGGATWRTHIPIMTASSSREVSISGERSLKSSFEREEINAISSIDSLENAINIVCDWKIGESDYPFKGSPQEIFTWLASAQLRVKLDVVNLVWGLSTR